MIKNVVAQANSTAAMSAGPDFGDFALFGISKNAAGLLDKLSARLGLTPQTIDFGREGVFYFYTTYGDLVETEALIALKLGFVRTPGATPLSTANLLAQHLISPQGVSPRGFRGNALVGCFSKTRAEFSVYQSLLSTPQLYYTTGNGDLLCSSSLRCLVKLLDQPALNEEILPYHFMFQLAPGSLTYFKNVYRLFPGQALHWLEGQLQVETIKTLQFTDEPDHYEQITPQTINVVYERIKAVINAYLDDAEQAGQAAANLLSGGVDSAIIQLMINEKQTPSARPKSFSYAVHVPGFAFEVDYAREASRTFDTNHTVFDIFPEDYPNILTRSIEVAAQPVPAEPEPCKMALAEQLAALEGTPRFFFVGQGADAVYGLALARKLAILNLFRKVPASSAALRAMAAVMELRSTKTAEGIREVVRALPALNNPDAYNNWLNLIATYTNLDIARRSFGDTSLQKALANRRQLERQYLNSSDLSEQVHMIDLLTDGYEPAVFGSQFFLANKKEQIYPYLDEDVIRIAFAFKTQARLLKSGLGFLSHRSTKPLLKGVLIQKGYGAITEKRKGASVFDSDLLVMMKSGPLRELVLAIDRPGFLSKADFDSLLNQPDWFLWNLLTFDIFQKRVLEQGG